MEHKLSISEEINLKELDDGLLAALYEQDGSPREVDRYVVDLSDLSFSMAPSLVNVLLLIGYLAQISKSEPILIPPNSATVTHFLSDLRFFVLAESLCILDKTRSIPSPVNSEQMAKRDILEVKHIPIQQTEEGFYNWLGQSTSNTIVGKFSRLADGRFAPLATVYIELCKNIFEHSRSFGYVAAQVYRRSASSPVFHATIGDLGIGIHESLHPFYTGDVAEFDRRYGPLWDEAKALDLAFAAGVSSKPKSGDQTMGIGLPTILEIVKSFKGSVICRSGRTKVFFGYWHNDWRTERKSNLAFFPGTHLEVNLPLVRS